MPLAAITAAEQLYQPALAIDQRDRHSVDFRLHPHALLAGHPACNASCVREFLDASVGNGVGNWAACAGQWAWACGFQAKALLQV
ncbi:hypothetical protein D3C76_1796610 [compost metagenome]